MTWPLHWGRSGLLPVRVQKWQLAVLQSKWNLSRLTQLAEFHTLICNNQLSRFLQLHISLDLDDQQLVRMQGVKHRHKFSVPKSIICLLEIWSCRRHKRLESRMTDGPSRVVEGSHPAFAYLVKPGFCMHHQEKFNWFPSPFISDFFCKLSNKVFYPTHLSSYPGNMWQDPF